MRQMRRLIDQAAKPNIVVEIVPFSAGVHPGLKGPFLILEFPDAEDDVLYLESPRGDLISREFSEEVLEYREVFELLRNISLGPEGSVAYLSEIADEMT